MKRLAGAYRLHFHRYSRRSPFVAKDPGHGRVIVRGSARHVLSTISVLARQERGWADA